MKTKFDKLPPQAIELEESILASCLIDPGAIEEIIDILFPDDFYRGPHQLVYRAMTRMYRTKVPIDAATLLQYLTEMGDLEAAGGVGQISKLLEYPPAIDLDHNAKKVREKSALREAIINCNAVMKRCYDPTNDAEETLDFFQKSANEISMYGGKGSLFDMKTLVPEAGDRYQRLWKNRGKVSGVPTGFVWMDYYLGGLQPGLNVLAARPSMGKTSLATDIMKNAAKQGYGGLMFSMEQGEDEIVDRMIAGEARVNLLKFRTGKFQGDDWGLIESARSKIYGWPIYIDPEGGLTVSEIKRRTRQYSRFNDLKFIVIDYLQLIKGPKAENRNHEIGEITRALKALSKETKIPILLLSQLNRELERRPNPNKRPRLSDLRDSGNIEQDADVVMFIYRPEVYNDEKSTNFEGQADIDIAKHRNGPTGMFSAMFRVRHTRFYDVEKTPEQQEQPT